MFGIKTYLCRNQVTINGTKAKKNIVNLEWWNENENLGDYLAWVVFKWMLKNKSIDPYQKIKKTKHLMSIGSIIGMANFDAIVWGSGIHTEKTMALVFNQRKFRNYDIRSVRGPVTKTILSSAGYSCPDIYGDPAILMPLIYKSESKKKYPVSIIRHISQVTQKKDNRFNYIDIKTRDYKRFINEIVSSDKVISSSLHGIILAESYGIPAIFLSEGMDSEKIKFFDWYLSTDRTNIRYAKNLDDALKMTPMSLPNLSKMREQIQKTFPYDLWC